MYKYAIYCECDLLHEESGFESYEEAEEDAKADRQEYIDNPDIDCKATKRELEESYFYEIEEE
jgi:hypothetical protein